MTSTQIRAAVKASQALRDLADVGIDNGIADALNESIGTPTPITVASLAAAAPQTLATIASAPNPLMELEVIAACIREGNAEVVGRWADTLVMLGKMPGGEHTAVSALVTAAAPVVPVTAHDVSAALSAHRPEGKALAIDWNEVN